MNRSPIFMAAYCFFRVQKNTTTLKNHPEVYRWIYLDWRIAIWTSLVVITFVLEAIQLM